MIKIHDHPNYDAEITDYDISILLLDDDRRIGSYVPIIALPEADDELEEGEMTFVSGWGATENPDESEAFLRGVELPIVATEKCRKIYRDITDRMICAGYEDGRKDACQGLITF